MKRNTGRNKVRWAELYPHEFKEKLADCPITYLPFGLCEPHGQISVLGLDLLKAEFLCEQAAFQCGGVVAPSMGYHIHETGYHARWLEEEVGETNPHMTSVPPPVLLYFFLYQLRACYNAGFKGMIALTGHSGGNQDDMRRVADVFMKQVPCKVVVLSDTDLLQGHFTGDHAGKYEISQLISIDPDYVDFSKKEWEQKEGGGGRLALHSSAVQASADHGQRILDVCIESLSQRAALLQEQISGLPLAAPIGFTVVESIWKEALLDAANWRTMSPWPGQLSVSENSRWKDYEYPLTQWKRQEQ